MASNRVDITKEEIFEMAENMTLSEISIHFHTTLLTLKQRFTDEEWEQIKRRNAELKKLRFEVRNSCGGYPMAWTEDMAAGINYKDFDLEVGDKIRAWNPNFDQFGIFKVISIHENIFRAKETSTHYPHIVSFRKLDYQIGEIKRYV